MATSVLHTTALVGDREVLASLRDGAHGTVHSAFRSVINLAVGQSELLSLTSASVARGPRSIRLGLERVDNYGILCGDLVHSDGHSLRIGDSLVVIVASTPTWADTPIAGAPTKERVARLEERLGDVPSSNDGAFDRAVTARVHDALEVVHRAVMGRDEDAAYGGASMLAGLGIGLTPTGDDILTGAAFVAARLQGSLAVLHRAVARVVQDGPTNDISLTALRCALRGRAVQPLEELYAWLCGDLDDNLDDLVAEVLAIGHTSGADLALGLLTAVRLHLESQEH